MFDITSSKLLILAIVALIVVGPKDLPLLLRTVGKYLGIVRRHAADFRAQLDEAMREAEFDDIKKEFDNFGREMHASIEDSAAGQRTKEIMQGKVDGAAEGPAPQLGSSDAGPDAGTAPSTVPSTEAGDEPVAEPGPLMTPIKQTGTER
jgi:sec-independent protein translocase protein TatB